MDEEIKSGYVAGIIGLIIGLVLVIIAVNSGLNSTGEIFGALGGVFSILGIGSLWKPKTIGTAFSQVLENMSRNVEEQTKTTSNKQTQKNTRGSGQVIAQSGSQVKQTIIYQQPEKEKKAELDKSKLDILSFLNEEFNKNPYNWVTSDNLTQKLGLSIAQLEPHIKYLEDKGFIKVTWTISQSGKFLCQIKSNGIDNLQ